MALRGCRFGFSADVCELMSVAGGSFWSARLTAGLALAGLHRILFSSAEAIQWMCKEWEKRYLPRDGTRVHLLTGSTLSAILLLAARSRTNPLLPWSHLQRACLLQLGQDNLPELAA